MMVSIAELQKHCGPSSKDKVAIGEMLRGNILV